MGRRLFLPLGLPVLILTGVMVTGCEDVFRGMLTFEQESIPALLEIQALPTQDHPSDVPVFLQWTLTQAESPQDLLEHLARTLTPDTLQDLSTQKFDLPRTHSLPYYQRTSDTEVHLPDGTRVYLPHRLRTHKIRTVTGRLTDGTSFEIHVFALRKCNSNNGKGRHHYYDYWSPVRYRYDIVVQFPNTGDHPESTFQARQTEASQNLLTLVDHLSVLRNTSDDEMGKDTH